MTSKLLGGTLPGPTENIKLFVCGPPPQVAAISGGKDKSEQGELSGVLAELGYKAEQVSTVSFVREHLLIKGVMKGLQVLSRERDKNGIDKK